MDLVLTLNDVEYVLTVEDISHVPAIDSPGVTSSLAVSTWDNEEWSFREFWTWET